MHMEADHDSLQQLDACGVSADVGTIRPLMNKHANIHCDLAWRSPPVARGPQAPARVIFDETGVRRDWLDLIEHRPDRFMIGTDAYCCDYSQVVDGFRKGLLPWLSPATLRKVAYENARRLMKLNE